VHGERTCRTSDLDVLERVQLARRPLKVEHSSRTTCAVRSPACVAGPPVSLAARLR
jgi:hypothetical protein